MKDPRILCVRMSLNEAISDLQDMALAHPAERDSLETLAREASALRDKMTAFIGLIPPDPQAREEALDNDPRVRAFTKEKAA